MALIYCTECGKSISDKAISCPGCGCPVELSKPENKPVEPPQQVDCTKLNLEQLWKKAYDIQYKGKKSDLPTAIEIYNYIVFNFSNSEEAGYAKRQLEILQGNSPEAFTVAKPQVEQSEAVKKALAENQTQPEPVKRKRFLGGRIVAGLICGMLLGAVFQNIIAIVFLMIVGAAVATFDLTLILLAGVVGVVIMGILVFLKMMVGM